MINPDAGGIELEHGRPVVAEVEATEKVYADYQSQLPIAEATAHLPGPTMQFTSSRRGSAAWPPSRSPSS